MAWDTACLQNETAILLAPDDYSFIMIQPTIFTGPCKSTYDVRSPPLHLACSDSVPCTDLKLSEIELLPSQGQLMANPFCWNAYGAMQNLTIPPVSCLLDGIPQFSPQNNIDQCQNNFPSVPSAYCGAFDITYMAPSDEAELMHIVATAAAIDDTEPAASGSHGQWDWNISFSEQQSNRTGGQKSDKWGNCLLYKSYQAIG
ncbi:hypothetical protein OIU78_021409 [Salix suchowensis]|nr:hypothetical protein OIU78_021409 [Salix suchowensis]